MSAELEKRIVDALAPASAMSAADLQALILTTNAAIGVAETAAMAARERGYDPVQSTDLAAAARAIEEARLRLGRLQTLLPRLQLRYAAALDREARAAFEQHYAAVKQRRDELAARFAKRYAAIVTELTGLIADMAEVDAECGAVNAEASELTNEHRRLLGCELHARNLENFSRDAPSLLVDHDDHGLRLPLFEDSTTMAWPPPRPSYAAQAATLIVPSSDPRRYSADWWQAADDDLEARERAAARHAEEETAAAGQRLRDYEASLLQR
jgi:hypothetical protein